MTQAPSRGRLCATPECDRWWEAQGRGPGTAPPAPPSQPTTAHVAHADLGKACLVLPGAPHVGDQQPTAGTRYPHRFVNRLLPARTSRDVVDRQTGDDEINTVVLKG